jgi:hypothetical protein
VLNVSVAEHQILESDVKIIEQRDPDSLRNGALMGPASAPVSTRSSRERRQHTAALVSVCVTR